MRITLGAADAILDKNGFIRIGKSIINPKRWSLRRVFTDDFEQGGRFYGWWQNLPKKRRANLHINGQSVFENDFPTLHPRLLFALSGRDPRIEDKSSDAYAIPNIPRVIAKRAVNIMLNARTPRAGWLALVKKIEEARAGGFGEQVAEELCQLDQSPPAIAQRTISAIDVRLPELRPYWGTGIGLRMQRVDASMASDIMRDLRRQGIPALCIHDSFIVPASADRTLITLMEKTLHRTCQLLARRGLREDKLNH